jgi:hypothetical protein
LMHHLHYLPNQVAAHRPAIAEPSGSEATLAPNGGRLTVTDPRRAPNGGRDHRPLSAAIPCQILRRLRGASL